MTEIEKLFEVMKDKDQIKRFECDYGRCCFQETATFSTTVLTFALNYCNMFIYNYFEDDEDDDEAYDSSLDQYVFFDNYGTGIDGLSFDCTEEEFNNANIENPNIKYQDLPILKEMYKRFEQYLDMDAVRRYEN